VIEATSRVFRFRQLKFILFTALADQLEVCASVLRKSVVDDSIPKTGAPDHWLQMVRLHAPDFYEQLTGLQTKTDYEVDHSTIDEQRNEYLNTFAAGKDKKLHNHSSLISHAIFKRSLSDRRRLDNAPAQREIFKRDSVDWSQVGELSAEDDAAIRRNYRELKSQASHSSDHQHSIEAPACLSRNSNTEISQSSTKREIDRTSPQLKQPQQFQVTANDSAPATMARHSVFRRLRKKTIAWLDLVKPGYSRESTLWMESVPSPINSIDNPRSKLSRSADLQPPSILNTSDSHKPLKREMQNSQFESDSDVHARRLPQSREADFMPFTMPHVETDVHNKTDSDFNRDTLACRSNWPKLDNTEPSTDPPSLPSQVTESAPIFSKPDRSLWPSLPENTEPDIQLTVAQRDAVLTTAIARQKYCDREQRGVKWRG